MKTPSITPAFLRRALLPVVISAVAALPGVARAADATPCAVLLGGGYTVTPDSNVNSRWFAINRVVSQDVEADLGQKGYKIMEHIVDIRDAGQRVASLVARMKETGCAKVVQLSIDLKGPPGGNVTTFSFNVSVLHLVSNAPNQVTPVGEFHKDYPYPLTQQTMENLSMSDVAGQITADLDGSGTLEKSK